MNIEAPKVLKKPIVVTSKVLMGSGPSNCYPKVLQALRLPILGHLHPECTKVMDDIKEGIRYVFQTKNEFTLALNASGYGGMEAVFCNLIEPGDKVLVAVNGICGERASSIAGRFGATIVRLETSPGTNFHLIEFTKAIIKHRPNVLFVAQGEISTGVYQPLEGLGLICKRYNCFLMVDTVVSLGGVPFYADRWGIDVVYTESHKVLGAPPGITPMSFSFKAQQKILNRKTPVKIYYWDLNILGNYWGCFGDRKYSRSISSNLLYALREALTIAAQEGIENVINRHKQCAQRLYNGLKTMNLKLFVKKESARLTTITAVEVPEEVDWTVVIEYAMKHYSLEISGGLGPTEDKVFRIGIMGYNASYDKIDFLLKVFKEALDFAKKNKRSKL